jgi:hypothetical protein
MDSLHITKSRAAEPTQPDLHDGKTMNGPMIANYARRKGVLGALIELFRRRAERPRFQPETDVSPRYGIDAVCCNCIYFRWASEQQPHKHSEEAATSSRSRGNCRRYPPAFVPLVWKWASSSKEDQHHQHPTYANGLFADISLPLFTWPIVWSRAFCGEFKLGIPTQAREQDRPHS